LLNDWVNEGAVHQAFGTTTGSKTWPLREAVWRRTRWWPLASPKAPRSCLGVPPCAWRVVSPAPRLVGSRPLRL